MTRPILFVQGGGEGVHDEWDNLLVESLQQSLGPGYAISYPAMPHQDAPDFDRWRQVIVHELIRLGDGAIAVGHSIGATILIHALAMGTPARLGAVMLIAAPFVGKGGWPPVGFQPSPDLGGHLPQGLPIYLYHGSDDETAPIAHLELYGKAIPQAHLRRVDGRDHQLGNDLGPVADNIRLLG